MSWFKRLACALSGACVPLLILTASPLAARVAAQVADVLVATGADVAEGEGVFVKNCALCHGGDATGGRGPDLTRGFYRNATSDTRLMEIVQNGIEGTGMPWTGLSDRKARQVVAFLRSLGGRAEPVPGDPRRGRELFFGSATCSTCHMVDGVGSRQGPDLSWVGWRRAPDYLRVALVDPNADVEPRWWTAQATTVGGEAVSGILIDEDQFTVRLLDAGDALHALAKSDLEGLQRGKTSRMPSFRGVLGDEDLDDIVAYLAGLRGGASER